MLYNLRPAGPSVARWIFSIGTWRAFQAAAAVKAWPIRLLVDVRFVATAGSGLHAAKDQPDFGGFGGGQKRGNGGRRDHDLLR